MSEPKFFALNVAAAEAAIGEFAALPAPPRRVIRSIDVHHTYRPHKGQWRGLATVEGMDAFHRSLGWSAIGQHWTIAPDGAIWTGRDLAAVPCSQTGFNRGALMFELAGNFCAPGEPGSAPPYDRLEGEQLEAAIALCAAVLANFGLGLEAVRFHRQLHLPGRPSPKTCPGNTVDHAWFQGLVEDRCWSRWRWDPPGGRAFDAEAAFDVVADAEDGSGEPEPEQLAAFLEQGGGSALA